LLVGVVAILQPALRCQTGTRDEPASQNVGGDIGPIFLRNTWCAVGYSFRTLDYAAPVALAIFVTMPIRNALGARHVFSPQSGGVGGLGGDVF